MNFQSESAANSRLGVCFCAAVIGVVPSNASVAESATNRRMIGFKECSFFSVVWQLLKCSQYFHRGGFVKPGPMIAAICPSVIGAVQFIENRLRMLLGQQIRTEVAFEIERAKNFGTRILTCTQHSSRRQRDNR